MLQYDGILNMLNEKKLQGFILYASIYGKYRHKHVSIGAENRVVGTGHRAGV